ncbi:MAG: TonB C-terminal domain-containing protein [Burkholderiales bacterium]|nr:TonB C-terminal domain-containing protein [Burkholderiales bacterium]
MEPAARAAPHIHLRTMIQLQTASDGERTAIASGADAIPGRPRARTLPRLRLRRVLAATILSVAAGLSPPAARALSPDETARLLGGMSALPADLGEAARAQFRPFVRDGTQRWNDYARRFGLPIQEWARGELGSAAGATVFYPFSGPDFPTAQQLYPDADRYVLVAIQPAGPPPALDRMPPEELATYLARFRRNWTLFTRSGYFRTNDLDADAAQAGPRIGVTGPLMAFAARLGYEVLAVEPVRVDAAGAGLEFPAGGLADEHTWDSVRLRLAAGGREVLLDYLRIDLSDANLRRDRAGAAFLEAMAANRIVLKAASHLLQRPHYSVMRNAILARAPSIWQDETGIDYANFAGLFDVTLYGRFTKAHRLFAPGSQSALADAYRRHADVRPLPFAVGYEKESGSSVQFALRITPPSRDADPELSRLKSRVEHQLAEYARRPRMLFLGGSPVEPAQAQYVRSVRLQLARVLAGAGVAPGRAPIISLTLAGDGSLRATDIARSSGSEAVDLRVRALVRAGGPFPRWPEAMRERADLLILTLHLPET